MYSAHTFQIQTINLAATNYEITTGVAYKVSSIKANQYLSIILLL